MNNKNNYCIILAGGVGRRLWPSSRKHLPKQFLDFFGTGHTLLQQTYDRFKQIIPEENILVSTFKGYADIVAEQLPGIAAERILAEPVQLSTAPAVAWASYNVATANPQATIVIVPADQCILDEASFVADVNAALAFASTSRSIIALGVPPCEPNTGYGYIQMGESCGNGFCHVKSFTEKPARNFAEMFVESGEFLWNTGLFVYSAPTILDQLNQLLPTIGQKVTDANNGLSQAEELQLIADLYPSSMRLSIDLVFLERCANVVVQKCGFGWGDVGSWQQLREMSKCDADGNAVLGGGQVMFVGCKDTLVCLPTGQKAVVQDLNGCLVAEQDGVLVVCPNDDASRIRRLVAEAQMRLGDEVV